MHELAVHKLPFMHKSSNQNQNIKESLQNNLYILFHFVQASTREIKCSTKCITKRTFRKNEGKTWRPQTKLRGKQNKNILLHCSHFLKLAVDSIYTQHSLRGCLRPRCTKDDGGASPKLQNTRSAPAQNVVDKRVVASLTFWVGQAVPQVSHRMNWWHHQTRATHRTLRLPLASSKPQKGISRHYWLEWVLHTRQTSYSILKYCRLTPSGVNTKKKKRNNLSVVLSDVHTKTFLASLRPYKE